MTTIALCSKKRVIIGDRIAGTPPTHVQTPHKVLQLADGVVAFSEAVHILDFSSVQKLDVEEVGMYIESLEFCLQPEPIELFMLSCKHGQKARMDQYFSPASPEGDATKRKLHRVTSSFEGAPGATMFIGGQSYIYPVISGEMVDALELFIRTCHYHLSVGVKVLPTVVFLVDKPVPDPMSNQESAFALIRLYDDSPSKRMALALLRELD